jgi:hypothetical protein
MQYPSVRYNRALPPVIVNSAEEDALLGDDWAASPAVFIEQPDDAPADLVQQEATIEAEEAAAKAAIADAKKSAVRARAKQSKQ